MIIKYSFMDTMIVNVDVCFCVLRLHDKMCQMLQI